MTTNDGIKTFVMVPGFGRCEVLRRYGFDSNNGNRILEVLTPAGTKLPVSEKHATPVIEETA